MLNPFRFTPTPSRFYCFYLWGVHCFAFACIWVAFSGALFFIFFILLISFGVYYYFCDSSDVVALTFLKATEWNVQLSNAGSERAKLLGSSVMFRYLMILHFQLFLSHKKISVVLFCDSFSKQDYQAVRRCVRMGYL